MSAIYHKGHPLKVFSTFFALCHLILTKIVREIYLCLCHILNYQVPTHRKTAALSILIKTNVSIREINTTDKGLIFMTSN